MSARRCFALLCVPLLSLATAAPALALANRVFVSARSGNNANSCDNVLTPCQTLAGAVLQLNPGGEAIVLDSGGYGPVTITKSMIIEAPAGVTAFIHPPSGDAITINAGSSDTVTLRGLVLSVADNGITVNSVGTLNVENCFINNAQATGIKMLSPGRLNVKGTDITFSSFGINILNTTGRADVSLDHCHLEGNFDAYVTQPTSPGTSRTTASHTTANNNSGSGWVQNASTGRDVMNLEFCSGSNNGGDGLYVSSQNAQSVTRYSNCVFANNESYGVEVVNSGAVQTRGNNTVTGNVQGATSGTIGSFSPM